MQKPEPPGVLSRAKRWTRRHILDVRRIEVLREFRIPSPAEDFPLRLYDVLYESGRFPAIYRVLGDLVLEAPLAPRKPHGLTVRLEALVPTSEEEVSLISEPKLRVIVRGSARKRTAAREGARLLNALDSAAQLLASRLVLSGPSSELQVLFPVGDWPEAYAVAARAPGRRLELDGIPYEVRLSLEGTALCGPSSPAPFRWAAALAVKAAEPLRP